MNTYEYSEQYQLIIKMDRKPDGTFDPGTGSKAFLTGDFLPDGGIYRKSSLNHVEFLSITSCNGSDLGKLINGMDLSFDITYRRQTIKCSMVDGTPVFSVSGREFLSVNGLDAMIETLEFIEHYAS